MRPYLKVIWFVLIVAAVGVLFYTMLNVRIRLSEEPKPRVTQGSDGRLEWHGTVEKAEPHATAVIPLSQETPNYSRGAFKEPGKSWQLSPGTTLDDVMNALEKRHEELIRCGQMGDWVLDQNGNVMYRRMNPPCPRQPKPKGYGNYCDVDLAAIGQAALAEKFRPRTLGCKDPR